MSSNESARPRRNPTRNGSSSSSSSQPNQASSSSSSTSRPVRSSRLKTTNHILIDDSSDESADDIKPLNNQNIKKTSVSNSANSNSKIDSDKLNKLETITGLSRAEAIQLLEVSNYNLDTAINLHFSGNIDANPNNSNQKQLNNKRSFQHVEESSSNDSIAIDDNVRAPIPKKSEKLLDLDPYSVEPMPKRVRSAFDSYRPDDGPFEGAASSSNSSKAKSLTALYKPPVDLIFKGSFESSKIEGSKKNKWILLNVQDQSDFACQCLNRDLWREDTVKDIIKANFIFVQVYFDSLDGKKMINYYRINSYPFLAILDPRTGENVMQFNNTNKMDQFLFCEKVTNFLCDYESPIKDFDKSINNQDNENEIVQIEDEDSKDCMLINNKTGSKLSSNEPKTIKASELIKELNGKQVEPDDDLDILEANSNSSDEIQYKLKKSKNRLDSDDESGEVKSEENSKCSSNNSDKKTTEVNYQPKMIKYETLDNLKKDCVLRILYPNGDRLDYCTSGDSKFKDLVDYLKKEGYKSKTHELIERLMPNIQSTNTEQNLSQTSKISNDLSNLIITNQSRNLLNLENNSLTFKELNLFPRVFLLLQEL